jgi:hypothetical protein
MTQHFTTPSTIFFFIAVFLSFLFFRDFSFRSFCFFGFPGFFVPDSLCLPGQLHLRGEFFLRRGKNCSAASAAKFPFLETSVSRLDYIVNVNTTALE